MNNWIESTIAPTQHVQRCNCKFMGYPTETIPVHRINISHVLVLLSFSKIYITKLQMHSGYLPLILRINNGMAGKYFSM